LKQRKSTAGKSTTENVFMDRPMFGGSFDRPVHDDNARSEANILCWMEYLPQDCIETMIRMGWDLTT
jgi:hypothetical protein